MVVTVLVCTSVHLCVSLSLGRTYGGEDAGKAEVVHCIQAQEMKEKLFFFLFAPQEGIPLVQLPVGTSHA